MKKKFIASYNEFWPGLVFFSLYMLWAFLWYIYAHFFKGDFVRPYIPVFNLQLELRPPSWRNNFFGTDLYGRSLFEVISMGLTYSLSLSSAVIFANTVIGVWIGYILVKGNAFTKGLFDLLTSVIFVFPTILIAIVIMSYADNSLGALMAVLIFTGWPAFARISRGEIKRVIHLPFVESSKALGQSELKIFFKVILPSILPHLLSHMILGMSGVILSESALGFLGLGGGEYSWGNLLSMGKTVLLEAPHVVIIIAICMAGLIFCLNLLGDGIRDKLDPHSKK